MMKALTLLAFLVSASLAAQEVTSEQVGKALLACGNSIATDISSNLKHSSHEYYNPNFTLNLSMGDAIAEDELSDAKSEVLHAFYSYMESSGLGSVKRNIYRGGDVNNLPLDFTFRKERLVEAVEQASLSYILNYSNDKDEMLKLIEGFLDHSLIIKYDVSSKGENFGVSNGHYGGWSSWDMEQSSNQEVYLEQTRDQQVFFTSTHGERFQVKGFPVIEYQKNTQKLILAYDSRISNLTLVDDQGQRVETKRRLGVIKSYLYCMERNGVPTVQGKFGKVKDTFSIIGSMIKSVVGGHDRMLMGN